MADNSERKMLFDVRGRRKNVLRVVYAVLALLMGTSLFFVVGPFNLAEVVGGGGINREAGEVLEEQAERIEERVEGGQASAPQLLSLARVRISAGNAQLEAPGRGATPELTAEAREQFDMGLRAWERYLEQVEGEPDAAVAQLVAGTYFTLAESAARPRELETTLEGAVTAQRIAAAQRPNLGSLSTLAIYEYYSGNFAAGDRATERAAERAPSEAEEKAIERELTAYRRRGKQLEREVSRALAESERGREALEDPLGGIGG